MGEEAGWLSGANCDAADGPVPITGHDGDGGVVIDEAPVELDEERLPQPAQEKVRKGGLVQRGHLRYLRDPQFLEGVGHARAHRSCTEGLALKVPTGSG